MHTPCAVVSLASWKSSVYQTGSLRKSLRLNREYFYIYSETTVRLNAVFCPYFESRITYVDCCENRTVGHSEKYTCNAVKFEKLILIFGMVHCQRDIRNVSLQAAQTLGGSEFSKW